MTSTTLWSPCSQERPVPIVQKLGGSQDWSGGAQKISPQPVFQALVCADHGMSLHRLHYTSYRHEMSMHTIKHDKQKILTIPYCKLRKAKMFMIQLDFVRTVINTCSDSSLLYSRGQTILLYIT